jgi:predicted transcriptional regulator
MTVQELEKKATLYQVAKILKLSPPAIYKWRKSNKIPALRLFQLKEIKPEWFVDAA